MKEKVFKMILEYRGKQYECKGSGWYEESEGKWVSPHDIEDDGVRTCEHDFASLLPAGVADENDFGCDEKEIKIIKQWWEGITL